MDFTSCIVGFFAGLTASMGLGGGFVLMVYLTIFAGVAQSAAGGINLVFFLPIALVSAVFHFRNGLVRRDLLPLLCVAGLVGAACGVFLMNYVNDSMLRKLFAALLLVVGVKEVGLVKLGNFSKRVR